MAYGPVNVGQVSEENKGFVVQDQVGVPGGIATLNADGKLTESQRPDIDCYTREETDAKVSGAVSTHDGSGAAHPGIRSAIDAVEASVLALELKFGTSVTENPFTVSFANLDAVNVTGVWNAAQARIEF